MKDERNVRRSRAACRKWQSVAILLAAVLMVLSMPLGLKTVHAVDLDQNCSLSVNPGSAISAETFDQEFADTSLVIDLYRIADAVPVKGYDTYDWTMNQPFSSLTIDKEIDSDGWKVLAQQAADLVLGKAPEGETEWDPSAAASAIDASLKSTGNKVTNQGGRLSAEISGLKAGLYLLIAHSVNQEGVGDPAKYAVAATDETGAAAGTATIANSHTYKYTFAPELVSLPTKEASEAGVISTGNPGDWIYDASVTLKPSQDVRLGNLEITKTLKTYAQREKTSGENPRTIKDPATFIFEVTAYEKKEADTVVFHDYVSLVFNAYGSRTAVVRDLPVDSYVVVKEAYSGRVYTTDTEKSTTIPVGSIVYVKDIDPSEVNTGDIIAFEGGDSVIMHRVQENKVVEGSFVTKGDANDSEDLGEVPYDRLIGIVVRHIPILGQILTLFGTSFGRICMVCFAACGALLNILGARLRDALKYAREEEAAGS